MYKKKTIIQKHTVEGIEKFINKFSRGGKEPKMLSIIKKINKLSKERNKIAKGIFYKKRFKAYKNLLSFYKPGEKDSKNTNIEKDKTRDVKHMRRILLGYFTVVKLNGEEEYIRELLENNEIVNIIPRSYEGNKYKKTKINEYNLCSFSKTVEIVRNLRNMTIKMKESNYVNNIGVIISGEYFFSERINVFYTIKRKFEFILRLILKINSTVYRGYIKNMYNIKKFYKFLTNLKLLYFIKKVYIIK